MTIQTSFRTKQCHGLQILLLRKSCFALLVSLNKPTVQDRVGGGGGSDFFLFPYMLIFFYFLLCALFNFFTLTTSTFSPTRS